MLHSFLQKVIRRLKLWLKPVLMNPGYVLDYYRQKQTPHVIQKTGKIIIVFLVQNTSVWNSVRSLYDAVHHDDAFEDYIVSLPPYVNGRIDTDNDSVNTFCEAISKNYIKGYQNGSYYSLHALHPDYIILNKPYSKEYPPGFDFRALSKIGKVCTIPYGYTVTCGKEMLNMLFNRDLFRYCSYLFPDNPYTYHYCKKKIGLTEFLTRRRVYQAGYPGFDLYENYQPNTACKTVLWLPRWTTDLEVNRGNEGSSFFLYKDHIIDFANRHPSINVIIRPHPLSFSNYVKRGLMTQEEVDAYIRRVNDTPNMRLDLSPSYVDSLFSADIFLADMTSLLVECFYMKKPVIYLGGSDSVQPGNRALFTSFYRAGSWNEIQNILIRIVNGEDQMMEHRDRVFRDFISKNPFGAGKRIAQILKDHMSG